MADDLDGALSSNFIFSPPRFLNPESLRSKTLTYGRPAIETEFI
jgi:hypothetical protein